VVFAGPTFVLRRLKWFCDHVTEEVENKVLCTGTKKCGMLYFGSLNMNKKAAIIVKLWKNKIHLIAITIKYGFSCNFFKENLRRIGYKKMNLHSLPPRLDAVT
jgi:hypothetical protein